MPFLRHPHREGVLWRRDPVHGLGGYNPLVHDLSEHPALGHPQPHDRLCDRGHRSSYRRIHRLRHRHVLRGEDSAAFVPLLPGFCPYPNSGYSGGGKDNIRFWPS